MMKRETYDAAMHLLAVLGGDRGPVLQKAIAVFRDRMAIETDERHWCASPENPYLQEFVLDQTST